MDEQTCSYSYGDAEPSHTADYLWPHVFEILEEEITGDRRVFDLGCGNGALAAALEERSYDVTGVDPSEAGIREAKEAYPGLDVHVGSAYDDLEAQYGSFPAVVSLEVVEHVYYPRKYAACVYDLLERGGGVAVLSTPYHGYLKNLAMALLGKIGTTHYSPLWTHGHIKIWSPSTLHQLLEETGFRDIQFRRVGRIPPLAKSMIAIAKKPCQ